MKTYEQELMHKLNKIIDHGNSRIAFKSNNALVGAVYFAQTLLPKVQGCNVNRDQRLSFQRKLRLVQKLIWCLAV